MTPDNKNLYYELHGDTNSLKWLVFLNGLAQTTQSWTPMISAFEGSFRIVLLDFILQGRSDKRGDVRDFDRHAEDLLGLIDSLNAKRINLVGISYGSLVAQHFAVNFPDRLEKLVLLSTFAQKTAYYEAIEFAWLHALKAGGYPLLLDVMLPQILGEKYFEKPFVPVETLKKLRSDSNADPLALEKLLEAMRRRGDYRARLKTIKTPTLVIHGERDILFPLSMGKEAADSIPGSRIEVIRDVGHTLNLEAAAETAARIKDFL